MLPSNERWSPPNIRHPIRRQLAQRFPECDGLREWMFAFFFFVLVEEALLSDSLG